MEKLSASPCSRPSLEKLAGGESVHGGEDLRRKNSPPPPVPDRHGRSSPELCLALNSSNLVLISDLAGGGGGGGANGVGVGEEDKGFNYYQ